MGRWFKKELVSNHITEAGHVIRFQPVGNNTGVIELDETRGAALISVLDQYADRRKLGVVRISAEIADALKKKAATIKSRPAPGVLQGLRIANRDLLPKRPKDAISTSAVKAAAINNTKPAAPAPPAPAPAATTPVVPRRVPKSKVESPAAKPA